MGEAREGMAHTQDKKGSWRGSTVCPVGGHAAALEIYVAAPPNVKVRVTIIRDAPVLAAVMNGHMLGHPKKYRPALCLEDLLEAGSPAQGPAGSRPIRLPSGLCSFRRLQVTICVLACSLRVPRLGVPFLPLQGRTQQVVSFSRPLPLTSCCPPYSTERTSVVTVPLRGPPRAIAPFYDQLMATFIALYHAANSSPRSQGLERAWLGWEAWFYQTTQMSIN